MNIRTERPGDEVSISRLVDVAFAGVEHSNGQEASIVEKLRDSGDLTISLVVEEAGRIVGHVAFSPVDISNGALGWYGLGPVAVLPSEQGRGIGKALINQGLADLRASGAKGCVVLGDPAYYGRFGFTSSHDLVLPGIPPEYFQSASLDGASKPKGVVAYSNAFD